MLVISPRLFKRKGQLDISFLFKLQRRHNPRSQFEGMKALVYFPPFLRPLFPSCVLFLLTLNCELVNSRFSSGRKSGILFLMSLSSLFPSRSSLRATLYLKLVISGFMHHRRGDDAFVRTEFCSVSIYTGLLVLLVCGQKGSLPFPGYLRSRVADPTSFIFCYKIVIIGLL